MAYRAAADLIVLLHLAFIVFVLAGGLLALRWRWMPLLHLPAVVWGVLVELRGWVCPLTPLESRLREAGGAMGYPESFVEHYVVPIVYPTELTRELQVVLGLAVLCINAAVYARLGWVIVRARTGSDQPSRERRGQVQ